MSRPPPPPPPSPSRLPPPPVPAPPPPQSVPAADCAVLQAAFPAIFAPDESCCVNTQTGWQAPTTIVVCNNTQVIQVVINYQDLSGPIPDLSKLAGLAYLDLSHNALSGPIPPTINGNLKLQYLILAENQLTEPLPNLTLNLLQQLQLDYNALSGSIPASYATLPGLFMFTFGNNPALSGPFPEKFAALDPDSCSGPNTQVCIPDLHVGPTCGLYSCAAFANGSVPIPSTSSTTTALTSPLAGPTEPGATGNASTTPNGSGGISRGLAIIIGSVCGGVVLLAIIIAFAVRSYRKKNRLREDQQRLSMAAASANMKHRSHRSERHQSNVPLSFIDRTSSQPFMIAVTDHDVNHMACPPHMDASFTDDATRGSVAGSLNDCAADTPPKAK